MGWRKESRKEEKGRDMVFNVDRFRSSFAHLRPFVARCVAERKQLRMRKWQSLWLQLLLWLRLCHVRFVGTQCKRYADCRPRGIIHNLAYCQPIDITWPNQFLFLPVCLGVCVTWLSQILILISGGFAVYTLCGTRVPLRISTPLRHVAFYKIWYIYKDIVLIEYLEIMEITTIILK